MVKDIFDLSGVDQERAEGTISKRQKPAPQMATNKTEDTPNWGDGQRITKIMKLIKHMEKENLIEITPHEASKIMTNSQSSATVLLSTSNRFKRIVPGVYELIGDTPEETVQSQPTPAPEQEEPKQQKMEKNTARIVKPLEQILQETKKEPKEKPTQTQTTKKTIVPQIIRKVKYYCPHCGKELERYGDDEV